MGCCKPWRKRAETNKKIILPWSLKISDGSRNFLRRLTKERENPLLTIMKGQRKLKVTPTVKKEGSLMQNANRALKSKKQVLLVKITRRENLRRKCKCRGVRLLWGEKKKKTKHEATSFAVHAHMQRGCHTPARHIWKLSKWAGVANYSIQQFCSPIRTYVFTEVSCVLSLHPKNLVCAKYS